jgi:hypothetical protein
MKHLRLFNNNSLYQSFVEGESYIEPNVSYIVDSSVVIYNKLKSGSEEPTVNVGTITNDNSIVVDETQLENGTYTLRYIDSNDNIIDNFNEITTFEINN